MQGLWGLVELVVQINQPVHQDAPHPRVNVLLLQNGPHSRLVNRLQKAQMVVDGVRVEQKLVWMTPLTPFVRFGLTQRDHLPEGVLI